MTAIYEYICPNCGQRFEERKMVEQRHEANCPRCNTESKLVPSRFQFRFEGGV